MSSDGGMLVGRVSRLWNGSSLAAGIGTSIRRALRVERTAQMEDMHFHSGVDGRVYPCDFARCESPHLTPHEIDHAR